MFSFVFLCFLLFFQLAAWRQESVKIFFNFLNFRSKKRRYSLSRNALKSAKSLLIGIDCFLPFMNA